MKPIKSTLFLSAAAFALMVTAAPVHAQQGGYGGAQQPHGMESPAVDVSDSQLQQFAAAREQIEDLSMSLADTMQNATPEERQDIQAQANEQMLQIVEGAGLSAEEYNQIAMALQADPDLQQRYQQMAN